MVGFCSLIFTPSLQIFVRKAELERVLIDLLIFMHALIALFGLISECTTGLISESTRG